MGYFWNKIVQLDNHLFPPKMEVVRKEFHKLEDEHRLYRRQLTALEAKYTELKDSFDQAIADKERLQRINERLTRSNRRLADGPSVPAIKVTRYSAKEKE